MSASSAGRNAATVPANGDDAGVRSRVPPQSGRHGWLRRHRRRRGVSRCPTTNATEDHILVRSMGTAPRPSTRIARANSRMLTQSGVAASERNGVASDSRIEPWAEAAWFPAFGVSASPTRAVETSRLEALRRRHFRDRGDAPDPRRLRPCPGRLARRGNQARLAPVRRLRCLVPDHRDLVEHFYGRLASFCRLTITTASR
jgi:hypothetical protein